ncbi:MAG: class I SAM-dependent methyltransferase [Cognatishimia sp.]
MKQSVIELEDTPKEVQKLKREIRKLRVGGDYLDLVGDPIPQALEGEYNVDEFDERLTRGIQRKYKRRSSNIQRCWNRTQLFLPELMHHDSPSQRVLEMSTAHGGMLEVLRHFGHEVMGNDYANLLRSKGHGSALFRNLNDSSFTPKVDDFGIALPEEGEELADWPYRKIIESINIPMALFDGGKTPYPFEDKSFDVLMCMQAIEHYCHPKDWMKVVDEFCRITNKTIIILLNPKMETIAGEPDDYAVAFDEARQALRQYRKNGFVCSSSHMMWGETLGFKLTAR